MEAQYRGSRPGTQAGTVRPPAGPTLAPIAPVLDPTHAVTTLLLQVAPVAHAAATFPDTVITKQVTAEPGIFTKLTTIASGLMTLALLVLAVALTPAAWNFRKTYKRVNELLDKIYGDLQPLVRSASVVAEDAREVMTVVKGDVRQVQQTVAAANARLLRAVRETEARIDEFNALLEVVQDEAEDAFVTTASTVRGVRTGLGRVLDSREEMFDGDDGDAGPDDDGRGGSVPRTRPRIRARPDEVA